MIEMGQVKRQIAKARSQESAVYILHSAFVACLC